jgi:hypothetical protein
LITSEKLQEFFKALKQLRIRRDSDKEINEENLENFKNYFTNNRTINKDDIDKFVIKLYDEGYIMGISQRVDNGAIIDHHINTNIIRTNYDDIQTTIDLYIDEYRKKGDNKLLVELNNLKSNFALYRENLADFPIISNELKAEIPELKIALKEHAVISNPIVQYLNGICERHHQYNFVREKNNSENPNELRLLDNHSKSIYRIIEKGLGEKNGDFSKITDAARASLVFDDAYSLDRSLKNLNYVAVKKGHQIVESEDFIVKSGTFHIKFLINIKLDDKTFFPSEHQFIDQAQKKADKYTHQIFNLMRVVTGENRSIDIDKAKAILPSYAEKLNNIITALSNPNDNFLKKIRNVKLGEDNIEKIVDELRAINIHSRYKALGIEKIENIGDAEKLFLEKSYSLLSKAHLFVICASLKSRNSNEIEGEGLSDPSVSALYKKMASDLNYKNVANPAKQIPEENLPTPDKDFEQFDFNFAEKIIESVRKFRETIKVIAR